MTSTILRGAMSLAIPSSHLEPLPCACRCEYPGSDSIYDANGSVWEGLPLMEVLACLNGEIMPVERAFVPVWDRGFLFGDSVYEVFRMYGGRRWLEAEHLARLKRSLNELEFPHHNLERLLTRMDGTIARSGIREGTVYVQVTRGVAPRAHAFPDPPVLPTELIVVRPYDDGPAARLREIGARMISRADHRWKRCDIKSTNLLANVLASEAARRAGCHEAVLIDSEGFVTEATHSSLLWVRQGRLEGTPEGHEILPGMTRALTLRLIKPLGIPFAGTRVTLPTLVAADEVILVGTTYEVLPVIEIDGQAIGSGTPGPLARRLGELYRYEVERWLAGPIQSV
jgi:D-alanine transaminase